MKKFLVSILVILSIVSLCACGSATTEVTASETQGAETSSGAEELEVNAEEELQAKEEADKAKEEAKKAEEEKKAKEEEARKAESERLEKEAEAKKAEEDAAFAGIDDAVDRSKIVILDEEQIMYGQQNGNIRKGPSTDYDKVGTLKVNDEITVIGRYEKNGWYFIKYNDAHAFVSNNLVAETEVDLDALKAQQEAEAMALIEQQKQAEAAKANQQQAPAQAQAPAPAQAEAPAAAPATPVQAPAGILFIGDSRCVQMQAAVGGIGSWICEGGKRYEWFEQTAIPQADPIVGKGTKVVICMGVNDPGSCGRYAALTNAKAAEWAGRGAKVYYVSVNPVWENPWVTQEQVDNFNASMPGLLSGVRWIDTASVLKANGFKLVDGLHYDTDTYVYIFNLIAGSLK